MISALAFVATLAVVQAAPGVAAAPDTVAQAPPTAAEIAAARAHADSVVTRADARAHFENITTDATPTVRHTASGMTCAFTTGDDRDNIRFYPAGPDGPPAGDDVSCGGWIEATFVSTFATRYPGHPTREAVFQSAMSDVPRGTPGAQVVAGEFSTVSIGGRPAPLIGVYHMSLNGQPKQSYVLTDQIGDWTYQARGTGPVEDTTVNLITAMWFALSLPGSRDLVKQ